MQPKKLLLIRHGETEWALSGQHTGKTDIPLTPRGEKQSAHLAPLLQTQSYTKVLISPSKRARDTFALAQTIPCASEVDNDLHEWDYGLYEGLTSKDIWKNNPDWDLFTQGTPGGESPDEIVLRARRVLEKAEKIEGNVALFSSGHILRVIATVWLKLPVSFARHLALAPASLSILGKEHNTPAILLWNRTVLH